MRNPTRITGLRRRHLCTAGVLALAAPSFAADSGAPSPKAMAPPAEVAGAVASPRLRGRGTLRFFGLLVYEARLWAGADFEAKRYDGHAFALELQYARKLEGAAIAQRSIVEMRRTGNLNDSQAQAWQTAMTSAFPNVIAGDRLTGVHVPGEATRFFHNGVPTSMVADPMFGRAFFGIWLAASTSEPDLRRQLIGSASAS
jgi:Chalcone isomerase-like